uniref:Replication protein A 70 kDa DNA-binding subunit A isoform X2 n=1 Tax=Nicotiana tabacum TaxID=4097 RepID=A0A1S4BET1_TOBAC|nr:PREDICTED: replication protein A 70 kDa DNA-binding subunit A-like isoform X2 [Nicotiana tabacum]XP_018626539.1 replication protein A 70 kDa DNA-binding subunit A-like isoform X3 [Nicotiana tomentosiformis]
MCLPLCSTPAPQHMLQIGGEFKILSSWMIRKNQQNSHFGKILLIMMGTNYSNSLKNTQSSLLEKLEDQSRRQATKLELNVQIHEGLANRFSTTIEINPPYPQAKALRTWAQRNEQLLIAYTVRSTSPTGSLLFVLFEEEIVPIAEIQQQAPGQIFYIQAEVALKFENQRFCILACSDCKQHFTRAISRRKFYCTNSRRSTQLVPRCQFEVTLTDQSGSTTATIFDEHAEKILLLTSEEIYDICNVKKELLPLVNAQKLLTGKIFRIQIKKLFTKYNDAMPGKLVILSFMDKSNLVVSQMPSTIKDVAEASKRKIEHVATEKQDHPHTTNKDNASYSKCKAEMQISPPKNY